MFLLSKAMNQITKPVWLNKKISLKECSRMKQLLRGLRVETVCEQAMCPNIGECFAHNQATFLILGRHCTRLCSFCNIEKAKPHLPDPDEPRHVACAVEKLCLKHVVITSVTRDDLADGGAGAFAEVVWHLRARTPQVTIELLVPDFKLSLEAVQVVVGASPDILAHNLETVPSLYNKVRQGAQYLRSLNLLRLIKESDPRLKTKSGLMLGLGETKNEVYSVMKDLRSAGCDFLSIGQYLAPSKNHYPVQDYIPPEVFSWYKQEALNLGFLHVESSPYVRSSYMSGAYLK